MTLSFDALSQRIGGKNVLIFRAYGISFNHFAIEQAVCGQLKQMGANVKWLVCNGIFIECDLHWQSVNRNNKHDACTRCVGAAQQISNQFGLDMAGLGAYLEPADYARVDQWVLGLEPTALHDAELNGWRLGEWVRSSVNTQLRCAHIELGNAAHVQTYRAYLHAGALTAIALTKYLAQEKVDALFMMNARTAATRTVLEIARAMSIPVAVHEFGRSEETRHLYLNEGCLSMQGWNRHWQAWKDIPLTAPEVQQVRDYLRSRLGGAGDYAFNKNNTLAVSDFVGDTRRKIVSVFTSSTDEIAAIDDWQSPYSQIDWLREIVAYFKARPEYFLVIRCHPNHDSAFYGRDYQFLDALKTLDIAGAPNIRLVAPNEKLNSYQLVLASDATMAFGSTISVEASLLGFKTMMAGSSRNQRRGAAALFEDADVTRLGTFLDTFLAAPVDPRWQINAARWTYLYAYRYAYDIPLVRREGQRLACLPTAFTSRLEQWPMLSHLIEFFTTPGDSFVAFPAPASVDASATAAEQAAIAASFNELANDLLSASRATISVA